MSVNYLVSLVHKNNAIDGEKEVVVISSDSSDFSSLSEAAEYVSKHVNELSSSSKSISFTIKPHTVKVKPEPKQLNDVPRKVESGQVIVPKAQKKSELPASFQDLIALDEKKKSKKSKPQQ